MSRLSELLNPAPPNGPEPMSDPTQPLTNGASNHNESDQNIQSTTVFTGLGNAPRRQSITSPLDALAAAATNSAPLPSPSRPSTNFVDAHHQTLPASSSRPTSSHASPPRNAFELPPLTQATGSFSPGLERYHQATSEEVKARRLSNDTVVEDRTQILPPLTQIQPEMEPLTAMVNARSRSQEANEDQDNNGALTSAKQSPEVEQHTSSPKPISPVITQVRQPSLGPSQSIPEAALPETQTEQVQVKTEMAEVPSPMEGVITQGTETQSAEAPAAPSLQQPSATAETPPILKSVADLKREASNQPSPAILNAETPTPKTADKPKATNSKKRAAPKKGTASTVKPPAKKRKVEKSKPESVASSPALPRNDTPASRRASKTPAPKNQKQGSVTPARSSSVVHADEEEYEDEDSMSIDENEQFCICRGPDDHTWMIACDGGCDDWFHGRCVQMDEKDGKLIEKYICPNCKEAGRGSTLWKPMCRLSTCRNPARVDKKEPSKYCCDQHGEEFMRRLWEKDNPISSSPPPLLTTGRRKSRKDNYTDHIGNDSNNITNFEDPSEGNDGAHLRGGVLRPAELKMVASSTNSIDEFHKLGEGVQSPPPEADEGNTTYTPEETTQLAEIKTKTTGLKDRKRMLDDKDNFLGMVKTRAKSVTEELKKKNNRKGGDKSSAICGFDSRLAWADEEFEAWRGGDEAKEVFRKGSLGPVFLVKEKEKEEEQKEKGKKGSKKKQQVNGAKPHDDAEDDASPEKEDPKENEDTDSPPGLCTKKGCRRHKDWSKVQTSNIAFEKESVRVEMKRLLAEEKGIRERAMIRGLAEER